MTLRVMIITYTMIDSAAGSGKEFAVSGQNRSESIRNVYFGVVLGREHKNSIYSGLIKTGTDINSS